MLLPNKLQPGDVVAVLSPSWAGPSVFPWVYENGLKMLESLGLVIKEYPTTRASHEFLSTHPDHRARDLNAAFWDPQIKAIFASIGWDDSVRVLPFLDTEIIKNNPKILMGYSDTTTLLTYFNQLGLVTFYGPAVMAGFSQLESLGEVFKQHIGDMLFEARQSYEYTAYTSYHEGYPDWGNPWNIGQVASPIKNPGWNWLQGIGSIQGELFGGCIEVLEFMKATDYWPERGFWQDKILFFETSDHKPTVDQVRYMLRNYGLQGVFSKASAVIFWRTRNYTEDEKDAFDRMVVNVIADEFGCKNLPVITRMDFGHTDPQFILPLWATVQIDCATRKFKIVTPWLKGV